MPLNRYTNTSLPWLLAVAAVCLSGTAQTAKNTEPRCKSESKAAVCQAQPSPATTPQSDTDVKAPASAADFAFPTEDSKHGADPDGTTHTSDTPRGEHTLPDMPTSGVPDPPASSEVPIGGSRTSPAPSSSNDSLPPGTSSSQPDGNDVDDDVMPTTPSPNTPVNSARLKDMGSRGDSSVARQKLETTRVADDIKVGLFYRKDGNTQGAYLRFKDAAEHVPDDPDVRFYLAESADRLSKREEAVLNYRACLHLDPGGDHDKAARKALQRLQVAPQ